MTNPWILMLIAAVLFAILVNYEEVVELLKRVIDVEFETIEQLEWRKEIVSHAAFYGAVVAGVLGFQHDSKWTKVVAAIWFVMGLWLARRYANIVHEKEEHEKSIHWRKLAGMIRSVTRSEIERKDKLLAQEAETVAKEKSNA